MCQEEEVPVENGVVGAKGVHVPPPASQQPLLALVQIDWPPRSSDWAGSRSLGRVCYSPNPRAQSWRRSRLGVPQLVPWLLVQGCHKENHRVGGCFPRALGKAKAAAPLNSAFGEFKGNPLPNYDGNHKYADWHKSNTKVVPGPIKREVLTGLEFRFQPP